MIVSPPHKVLILASDGFEEDELFVPLERLRAAGCVVTIAAPGKGAIQATVLDAPGRSIDADMAIADVDALVAPGSAIDEHARAVGGGLGDRVDP